MEESLIQVQNRLQLGRYKARLKQLIFFCWVSLTILLIIWSVVEHWLFPGGFVRLVAFSLRFLHFVRFAASRTWSSCSDIVVLDGSLNTPVSKSVSARPEFCSMLLMCSKGFPFHSLLARLQSGAVVHN